MKDQYFAHKLDMISEMHEQYKRKNVENDIIYSAYDYYIIVSIDVYLIRIFIILMY